MGIGDIPTKSVEVPARILVQEHIDVLNIVTVVFESGSVPEIYLCKMFSNLIIYCNMIIIIIEVPGKYSKIDCKTL